MNDVPDKREGPEGLDVVLFSVSGWRVGFEAHRIRASSLAPVGSLGDGIEARLGFSPGAPKVSATSSQLLLIKNADDDAKGDTEILVDGPVDLVCLPVAAIHPLPPLLIARTQLHGLRAIALEPGTVVTQIVLLFDTTCWPRPRTSIDLTIPIRDWSKTIEKEFNKGAYFQR